MKNLKIFASTPEERQIARKIISSSQSEVVPLAGPDIFIKDSSNGRAMDLSYDGRIRGFYIKKGGNWIPASIRSGRYSGDIELVTLNN